VPYEPKYIPIITDALLDAFSPLELVTLCAGHLNFNARKYQPADPFADIRQFFVNVTDAFNRNDLLADLVLAAWQERPRNINLARAAETLGLAATSRIVPLGQRNLAADYNLEKAVRDVQQHIDLPVLRERLSLAEQQTGLLEHATSQGFVGFATAFLIGPDRVLTNWHAAEQIESGQLASTSVRIRFGWKRDLRGKEFKGRPVELASDWLVHRSRYAAFDIKAPPQADPTPTELDYAVIALSEPIGNQLVDDVVAINNDPRGWFVLADCRSPPPAGEPLLVLGHPVDHPLTVSIGRVLKHEAVGRRIRHDAWTLPGSSGSPVLDGNGQLCGLHHATEPGSGKQAAYNRAIPMTLIAADIPSGKNTC
jgi:hypothetical protein